MGRETAFDIDFFTFALDHTQDAIFLVDENAGITYVNQPACDMLGYTEDELLSLTISEIDPDAPLRNWSKRWKNITIKHSDHSEGCYRRKDGSYFPIELNANYFVYAGKEHVLAIARDISKRKAAENELEKNMDRYINAESIGHVGYWEYDLETSNFYGSAEAKRIYGFDPNAASFTIEEIERCIPERERVHQALIDLIENNKPLDLEFEIYPNNSTTAKIITSKARKITDETDHTQRIVGVVQDITSQKHYEEKINQLANIVQYSNDAIISKSLDGIILSWNKGAERIYGYSEQEVLGKPISIIVPKAYEENIGDILNDIRDGKQIQYYETQRISRDGRKLFVRLSVSPILDNTGKVVAASAIAHDITENKFTEMVDQSINHLIQYSLEHSLDDLLEETINEAEKLTGSKIGFYHFVNEDQINLTLQNWSTRTKSEFCKAEGKGLHYPIKQAGVWVECVTDHKPVIHNDYDTMPNKKGMPEGHTKVVRELVVPVYRGDHITAILGVGNKAKDYDETDVDIVSRIADLAWEITERKRVEENIHLLNLELENRVAERTMQLEAANKDLEAFAYSVSHDLRAPLRHINSFLELLREKLSTCMDAEGQHYMDAIMKSSNLMGTLIDGLLTLSRMSRYDICKEKINLNDLVNQIIEDLDEEITSRKIDWQIDCLPEINGDYAMMHIVFSNLISNALKFSRARENAIIEIRSSIDNEGHQIISVQDNGVGFDMKFADKLFGVFERLHSQNEFEGTGIGLATVKRIIDRHGGLIWAEGKPNVGAKFVISLNRYNLESAV